MSEFLNEKYTAIAPYVPGEQPQDKSYIKLNTNESPFPPSAFAKKLAREAIADCELYPDPEYNALVSVAAERFGVKAENLLFTNGSDEALSFAFAAYCADGSTAIYADITYGFYDVFANFYGAKKKIINLYEDFSIKPKDYFNANGTIFIANPNAPTGKILSVKEILSIVENNKNNVVVIDEAYIDFGGESVLPYINEYENLIVVRTFSKSRSMAGARVGFAAANPKLIGDLKLVKYSTNPFNLSKMNAAAALGSLLDEEYFAANCKKIIDNRNAMTKGLKKLGFEVIDSWANFVFAKTEKIGGRDLYLALKDKGVLIRHFDKPRISPFIRITVGNDEQTEAFLKATEEVVKELK